MFAVVLMMKAITQRTEMITLTCSLLVLFTSLPSAYFFWPPPDEKYFYFSVVPIALQGTASAFQLFLPYARLGDVVPYKKLGLWMGWLNVFLCTGQVVGLGLVTAVYWIARGVLGASSAYSLSICLGLGSVLSIFAMAGISQMRWRQRKMMGFSPIADIPSIRGTIVPGQSFPSFDREREGGTDVSVVLAKRPGQHKLQPRFNHYFPGVWKEDSDRVVTIGAIMPFYNEKAHELSTSLENLIDCERVRLADRHGRHTMKMHVLIVMDGWRQCHISMKHYLMCMFGMHRGPFAQDRTDEDMARTLLRRATPSLWRSLRPVQIALLHGMRYVCAALPEEVRHYIWQTYYLTLCESIERDMLTGSKESGATLVIQNLTSDGEVAPVDVRLPLDEGMRRKFPGLRRKGGMPRSVAPNAQGRAAEAADEERGDGRDATMVDGDYELLVTLLVKTDNRKKHNSHEWFLHDRMGFCARYAPDYAFATDCGTLFDERCVQMLVDYMDLHPDCSACTGRQRVKTAEMQGDAKTALEPGEGWGEWYMRHVQRYDFDSSFISYMGAFALTGFLPVIPGPCGLYRWSLMSEQGQTTLLYGEEEEEEDAGLTAEEVAKRAESALSWYFDLVNKPPEETDLTLATLMIAEDRVLSASAVVKTKRQCHMGLVPDALFYFDREGSIENLIAQRRRWLNGTAAGYYYFTVQDWESIWKCHAPLHLRASMWTLLLFQLLIYLVVSISPSIFLASIRMALLFVFPAPRFDQRPAFLLWLTVVALYVAFVVVHGAYQKYNRPLFAMLHLIGAMSMVLTVAGSFFYFVSDYEGMTLMRWVLLSVYTVMLAPILVAFATMQWTIGISLIGSVIPFYLFLPTMVAWFSAYSFARFWDLSWGNRPSAAAASAETDKSKHYNTSYTITTMIVCVNLLLLFVFVQMQTIHCGDPPLVVVNPVSQEAANGTYVEFYAEASGDPTPSVQWYRAPARGAASSKMKGQHANTLLFIATSSLDGSVYSAEFENTAGKVTSAGAVLSVSPSKSANGSGGGGEATRIEGKMSRAASLLANEGLNTKGVIGAEGAGNGSFDWKLGVAFDIAGKSTAVDMLFSAVRGGLLLQSDGDSDGTQPLVSCQKVEAGYLLIGVLVVFVFTLLQVLLSFVYFAIVYVPEKFTTHVMARISEALDQEGVGRRCFTQCSMVVCCWSMWWGCMSKGLAKLCCCCGSSSHKKTRRTSRQFSAVSSVSGDAPAALSQSTVPVSSPSLAYQHEDEGVQTM
eukprot:TRINITY_DN4818_c0_g1_i1.p1 TRINITY_DN4818_c0_g1~~TRINITY_DN4818_c0_g1_i1.p1  ORF type:complete len:1253 (+),score=304.11 TRINITY_DN4818_c0_g1_i1:1139-4897(+)